METLKLQFPLKYWSVNQKFGENGTPLYINIGYKGHNGIDLYAPDGTPVYAAHDGRVTFAGYDSSGGLGIRIRTLKEYDYKGQPVFYESLYWHLKKDSLKVTGSEEVKAGQLIGLADNTGLSTGSHLHFGLKPQKRMPNLYDFVNIEQDNGYGGAIDPAPYLPDYKEFNTTLKLGDTGFEVEKIQAFLVRHGFLKMPANTSFGFYGNLTRQAVYDFQLKYVNLTTAEKLLKGGVIGKKTLAAINSLHKKE